MNTNTFKTWLSLQKEKLDTAIANAGRNYWNANNNPNFGYDLNECQHESYNLIKQKDLCYDRPNTAFTYSLWYHARRVNTFLSHFGNSMIEAAGTARINIFDLGAGTGAVQWAIGLAASFFKENGKTCPNFKIVNVDISPFMLEYNRDYLWPAFIQQFPNVHDCIAIEYLCNSWMNTAGELDGDVWLSASYLFDISDADNSNENNYTSAVKEGFMNMMELFNPSKTLLLTSNQSQKEKLLDNVINALPINKYISKKVKEEQLWLQGNLPEISTLRKELKDAYSSYLTGSEGYALGNITYWGDKSFVSCCLTLIEQSLIQSRVIRQNSKTQIALFNAPIQVRREVQLNLEQKNAAIHQDRFTTITGPAGCGKSVVITERIKNLVESKSYDTSLRILVTTFNKELMGTLATWVHELLDISKCRMDGYSVIFHGSLMPNILFYHFDVLPPRLAGLNADLMFDAGLKIIAEAAINEIRVENKVESSIYKTILEPGYVVEEYHRIIYGLQYVKEEEYATSRRKGRTPILATNSESRKLLWQACMRFLSKLENSNSDSIIMKRHKLLKKLKDGSLLPNFTHIFVDEYQDCTQADYEIFERLLLNPENIVLGGDLAQAVHIGKVADIPTLRSKGIDRNRRHITLNGSYRLPYRVSEAITEISKRSKSGNIITPYKAAPPGARPIIVYADTINSIRDKVKAIYQRYKVYGIDYATVLEKDQILSDAMRAAGIPSKTDTILRLKGMEKPFIVWSTRVDILHTDDVDEFVYTILSRTSSILVIVISPKTLDKYYSILNDLNKERLIFWDILSKNKFLEYCQLKKEETVDSIF